MRPSCNTLLNQELIQTYIRSHGLINEQVNFEDQLNFITENPSKLPQFQNGGKQDLLNTIKLTPKLSQLNKKLPKAQYDQDKENRILATSRNPLSHAGSHILQISPLKHVASQQLNLPHLTPKPSIK